MSGVSAHIELKDASVRHALMHLVSFGQNPAPAMSDIAAYGEASTRERFRTETDPDGHKWKPSLRAQMKGGRTLTKDGHLGDSITHDYGADYAEWGTNMIYATIHNFGGEIKPKNAKSLRFRLANGAFVNTGKVVMPKRTFMGVNDQDTEEILDMLKRRIDGIAHAH